MDGSTEVVNEVVPTYDLNGDLNLLDDIHVLRKERSIILNNIALANQIIEDNRKSLKDLEDTLFKKIAQVKAELPQFYRMSNKLSIQEQKVLDLILKGKSHKEIGSAIHISERTSKFHMSNILRKMGCKDRHQLLARVLFEGKSE